MEKISKLATKALLMNVCAPDTFSLLYHFDSSPFAGSSWDFIRLVLNVSLKLLPPTGSFYSQVKGMRAQKALALYEQQLQQLSCPVNFSSESVCVPSYHEYWVFYKIWKKM